jgi:hypothetical protein
MNFTSATEEVSVFSSGDAFADNSYLGVTSTHIPDPEDSFQHHHKNIQIQPYVNDRPLVRNGKHYCSLQGAQSTYLKVVGTLLHGTGIKVVQLCLLRKWHLSH